MELKDKLMHLRTAQGLTQLDAAERLLVSRQAISRWETGLSIPSVDNLIRIGELYQVSLAYLMDNKAGYPPEPEVPPKAEPRAEPKAEPAVLPAAVTETLQELLQEQRREREWREAQRRKWRTWKTVVLVLLGSVVVALAAAELYHLIYPYGRPIPMEELPGGQFTQAELDEMEHFDFESFDESIK